MITPNIVRVGLDSTKVEKNDSGYIVLRRNASERSGELIFIENPTFEFQLPTIENNDELIPTIIHELSKFKETKGIKSVSINVNLNN